MAWLVNRPVVVKVASDLGKVEELGSIPTSGFL